MQINYFTIVLTVVLTTMISSVLTHSFIPILKNRQVKQFIKKDGPQSHHKKSGTPTMGGIPIIISLIMGSLVLNIITWETAMLVAMTLLFAMVGYIDDSLKVKKKQNLGFRAWQKIVMQLAFSLILAVYCFFVYGSEVWIPFYQAGYLDFGYFYIPFIIFVLLAMTNSVNLTDGLDGLAAGVSSIVAIFLAIVGLQNGHFAPVVFCAAVAGACIGFLFFNKYPAKIFMGDTGSMALGGALATAAIIMKIEFILIFAGLIYVIEALSVIIQVLYFKKTKKRVFKMAPIHHHFELSGMSEKSVVLMFYLFALLCCVCAYFII